MQEVLIIVEKTRPNYATRRQHLNVALVVLDGVSVL